MKNNIYLLGILVAILLIVGGVFKINHWYGSAIILTVSIFFFLLVFLPAALINNYRANGKKKKALYYAAFITLFVIFLAAIFKILHWPGGSVLLVAGMLMPIVLFLPVYLYFNKKEEEESLANFLYIIFFLVGMSAMTGFLAVDVSKEILVDTIRVTDISELSEYYNLKTKLLKTYKTNETFDDIYKKSDALIQWIEKMKDEIVRSAKAKNINAINENGSLEVWYLDGLSNRDAAIEIIVNQENGVRLKKEIDNFYSYLLTIPEIGSDQSLVQIANLPDLICIDNNSANLYGWNVLDINDPMSLIILKLTQIENSIQLASLEAMTIINSEPDI